jgi:DNA-binding NtrC family response regulator
MKKRILVVDDDDLLRDVLRHTLTLKGYETSTACDGKEALRIVAVQPIDLVLTDLMMPGKEGIETIVELVRKHPRVKIIAMSGGGRNPPVRFLNLARALGALQTLAKPFSNDELDLAIAHVLGLPHERS